MDFVQEWVRPIFRWWHVIAGVTWIGLLYFFNWINGPFGKAISAETKRGALPELLPRTLYWFRWGAAYTWITGILLLTLVYYSYGRLPLIEMDATMSPEDLKSRANMALLVGIGVIIVGVIVYDIFWKAVQSNEQVGVIVTYIAIVGIMLVLKYVGHFNTRALFIHIGAMFGSAMAFNVWFRIWPMQRKIIAAIKAGEAPDGSWGALAGLRSKHNTYMSIPLIFMMVSNHFPKYLGFEKDKGWILLAAVIAVGWLGTKFAYVKGASEAPTKY